MLRGGSGKVSQGATKEADLLFEYRIKSNQVIIKYHKLQTN